MKLAEEYVESRAQPVARVGTVEGVPLAKRGVMRAFRAYTGAVLSMYCPTRVHGRELLPQGSFLLCSNHCSHMDSAVLMYACDRPFEDFGLIAAQDYFIQGGRWKQSLRLLVNLLPVDRRGSRKAVAAHIEQCRQFVAPGNRYLIMYPEGTRSTSGEMAAFKKGAGMLASELALPIVPAYIEGTFSRWRKGTRLIRPGSIGVHFGRAIYPREFEGAGVRAFGLITETLEERVVALREAAREG